MKEGWTYKKLKEIGRTQTGTTPSKSVKSFYEGEIPFIRPAELDIDGNGSIEYNSELKLTPEGALKSRKISANSILMCCIGSVGKTGYAIKDVTCNQQINTITPYMGYNGRFVYYALIAPSFQNEVKKIANSARATLAIISKGKWEEMSIPVPSLSEQQSIVDYLDLAFAQIDELKRNAEKQLAEARALFQSALTQAMQPKPGWQEKRIKEIADVKGGKRVPKGYKLQSTKTNHPYIRVADFNNYGTIEMSDIQYISDDIFEQIKNYTITDKDLYVSIAGTIGKTGIIPSELNGANLTENACKLVFKKDINLRFVYLFTLSELFKKQVEKATKQASQPKLALTRLAEVKISIPSITEQQIIVEHLDALSNHVKELEEISRKTAAECDAMKQALLRQIFE